jgi:hypothetical protein
MIGCKEHITSVPWRAMIWSIFYTDKAIQPYTLMEIMFAAFLKITSTLKNYSPNRKVILLTSLPERRFLINPNVFITT